MEVDELGLEVFEVERRCWMSDEQLYQEWLRWFRQWYDDAKAEDLARKRVLWGQVPDVVSMAMATDERDGSA